MEIVDHNSLQCLTLSLWFDFLGVRKSKHKEMVHSGSVVKRSAQDRDSFSSDDLTGGGVVGPGQVEEVRGRGAAGRLEVVS